MSERLTLAARAIVEGGACSAGFIFTVSLAGIMELASGQDRLLTIRTHLASRPAGVSDSEAGYEWSRQS